MTAPLITNFEAMDHATLLAKLEGMRGDLIYESGDRLAAASRKILSAARTLQLKRDGVVWEGPAATAFHEWSQQLVTSAYELAEFARVQGSALRTAGEEMTSTVNSFPPVPTEAVETLQALTTHNAAVMALDPAGTTTAIQQQETLIEQERREAIGAMRRLASTYLAVRDSMGAYPRPQFHRAANVHDVHDGVEDPDDFGAGVSLVSAAAAGAAGQTSLAGEISSAPATYKTGTTVPNAAPWTANPGNGVAYPVAGPASYVPGALPAQFPAAQASTYQTSALSPNLGATAQTSPVTGLDAVSPTVPSGNSGISGGTAVVKAVAATAGPQGVGGPLYGGFGAVPGAVGRTGAPSRAGTTGSTPPRGRTVPRVDGVVGGTTRPGHAVPDEHRVGGGRVGGPMAAGGGTAPVTGGTATRTSTRRPPIGVPGGPVGGVPRSTAPGTRREFTAGGSGLRPRDGATSATSNGAVGRPRGGMIAGQPSARPDRSRRSRQRADYLEEEEETWVARRGDTVPPVIG